MYRFCHEMGCAIKVLFITSVYLGVDHLSHVFLIEKLNICWDQFIINKWSFLIFLTLNISVDHFSPPVF